MADSKVISMQPATEAASADLLYIVKPNTSPYDHKLTIANLFGGIKVPVGLENILSLGGTPQSLSAGGAISLTTSVTKLASPDGNGTLTIGDGVEGQIKVIVMTANLGGHTLAITSNIGHSSISFNSAGDTAILIFVGTNWYFIGGTAAVA